MNKKVLYIGQLTDMSGYGNAARNYIKCFDMFLDDSDIDFRVHNVSYETNNNTNENERELLNKYEIKDIRDFADDNTIVIVHQVPTFFTSGYWLEMSSYFKKENVVSSMAWEPNRLPTEWVNIYKKHVGQFIVYCEFTRQCFLSHGFAEENIHLIEHPIFDIKENTSKSLNREKFNIFSLSQWDDRKGWDILIPAVCHEFFHHNDVELTIKTFRNEHVGAPAEQERNAVIREVVTHKSKVQHYGKHSDVKINLICGIVEKHVISDLFSNSTVYCLPTRCDSFGLTIGEAVISKRAAIVPDLGGHRDYFSDDNPFLVKSKMQSVKIPKAMFSTLDMQLVETDYDDLRAKLRKAYDIWKNNPDDLAKISDDNFDFATTNVINNRKIYDKFVSLVGGDL